MRDDLKLLKKVFGFIFFFNISKNAFKTQDSMDFTRLEKFLTKNFIYYILHIFVSPLPLSDQTRVRLLFKRFCLWFL